MAAIAAVAFVLTAGATDAFAGKKKASVAVNNDKGYYKDILMDSGIGLTSRVDLPAARYLNLQMETVIGAAKKADATAMDTLMQLQALAGNALDENGILLYPDGAPRFRMVYVNGGNAMTHSNSMGQAGRDAFVNFVQAGGSYVGTCAGAFFACQYKFMKGRVENYGPEYIGVWPGVVQNTLLSDAYTGVKIEKNSALLKYYDFGGDFYVDSVRHNGGCFCYVDSLFPKNGEILARYDLTGVKHKVDFDNAPVIWAVKEKEEWGRVVSCGSHPEGITSGDRLHLYSAMARYAMEGNAPARVKGSLAFGEERRMTKGTKDADPAFTKIGDKQYHHFSVDVPKGTDELRISLKGVNGFANYDLYLFVSDSDLAFKDNARWQNITLGVNKEIVIKKPKAGKYYVSVFCDTTVDTVETAYGTQYTGRVDVLNGVPYVVGVNLPR